MITLPDNNSTPLLQSFWIVLWTVLITGSTFIMYAIFKSSLIFLLLLLLPVLIIPGYRNPNMVERFYKLFSRLLKVFRRIVLKLSLFIIYYIFLISYKIFNEGNQPVINNPSKESLWESKMILNLIGEKENHDVSIDSANGYSWFRPFTGWIMRTKKWWMFSLIPFIFIVSLISEKKDEASIDYDTYTLY